MTRRSDAELLMEALQQLSDLHEFLVTGIVGASKRTAEERKQIGARLGELQKKYLQFLVELAISR